MSPGKKITVLICVSAVVLTAVFLCVLFAGGSKHTPETTAPYQTLETGGIELPDLPVE